MCALFVFFCGACFFCFFFGCVLFFCFFREHASFYSRVPHHCRSCGRRVQIPITVTVGTNTIVNDSPCLTVITHALFDFKITPLICLWFDGRLVLLRLFLVLRNQLVRPLTPSAQDRQKHLGRNPQQHRHPDDKCHEEQCVDEGNVPALRNLRVSLRTLHFVSVSRPFASVIPKTSTSNS